MTVYNTSFMNNATNILDLMVGIGTSMGSPYEYLIGNLILLSFATIYVIIGSMKFDFNEVLITGSLLTAVIAILLWGAGMVMITTVTIPIIVFVIAVVFYLFT